MQCAQKSPRFVLLLFLTSFTSRCYGTSSETSDQFRFSSIGGGTNTKLPLCAQVSGTTAELQMQNLDTAELLVETAIQTQLSLGQTACLRVTIQMDNATVSGLQQSAHAATEYDTLYSSGSGSGNESRKFSGSFGSELTTSTSTTASKHSSHQDYASSSHTSSQRYVLYTFHYEGLQQEYPVKQRYEFAIPHVESTCICDCPGGDDICTTRYRYQNCSKGDLCVTTYHPHQSTRGCLSPGAEAELCCEVYLRPLGNRRFHALYLGQPITVVKLAVSTYLMRPGEEAKVVKQQQYSIPLDQAQAISSQDNMKIVLQAENAQLRLMEGMHYFSPLLPGELESPIFTGVPLNEPQEWNLGKLGWFRSEQGKWNVKNANLKFQFAQHTQVEDCKAQTYGDVYDAEFYNMDSDRLLDSFSNNLEQFYSWLSQATYAPGVGGGSAPVGAGTTPGNGGQEGVGQVQQAGEQQRVVKLVLNAGPSIKLNVELKDRPQLAFSFHESMMADFDGSIRIDRYSNRFLNLTFQRSRGTLIGAVYRSSSRFAVDTVLSTYVDSLTPVDRMQLLLLPSSVNSSRWVCFYPSTKPDDEKCKLLPYHSELLAWFTVPTEPWSSRQGSCPGCNEFSTADFLRYLNPTQWFNGISGTSEALALGVEVVLYIVGIVTVVAVCRKCVCPLLNWGLCSKSPPAKRYVSEA